MLTSVSQAKQKAVILPSQSQPRSLRNNRCLMSTGILSTENETETLRVLQACGLSELHFASETLIRIGKKEKRPLKWTTANRHKAGKVVCLVCAGRPVSGAGTDIEIRLLPVRPPRTIESARKRISKCLRRIKINLQWKWMLLGKMVVMVVATVEDSLQALSYGLTSS